MSLHNDDTLYNKLDIQWIPQEAIKSLLHIPIDEVRQMHSTNLRLHTV